jgi:hypothetical protein
MRSVIKIPVNNAAKIEIIKSGMSKIKTFAIPLNGLFALV